MISNNVCVKYRTFKSNNISESVSLYTYYIIVRKSNKFGNFLLYFSLRKVTGASVQQIFSVMSFVVNSLFTAG